MTLAKIRAFMRTLPFNTLVGLEVRKVHRDGLTVDVPMRPELLNALGTMHGGVYATLADVAVGMSLYAHFEGKRKATTVELKVNYFAPVREGRLVARCHLRRVGSSLGIGQVDLHDGEKRLVGIAIVTYKLL